MSNIRERLAAKSDELKDLLLRKNDAYGNSALEPVRIFSDANPVEQLKVRLDDKLSRLSKGTNHDKVPEDTLMDICGYLILLMVAQEEDEVAPIQSVADICPECGSDNPFITKGTCASDQFDADDWHFNKVRDIPVYITTS